MRKLFVAIAFVLGFSGVAKASILFEPYVGSETGTTSNPDSKVSGTTFGARLAYKLPMFVWLGLDANMGLSGEYAPTTGSSATVKHNTYYGVVGVNLPILARIWAGYGFSDQYVIDSPYNSTMSGTNMKFGLGLTPLPLVSINVEYIQGTTSKIDGGTLANSNPSTTNQTLLVSLSLPLYF